jgi:hypothetical protein
MGKVKLKTVAASVAATIGRMAGKNYQGIAVVSSLRYVARDGVELPEVLITR